MFDGARGGGVHMLGGLKVGERRDRRFLREAR